MTQLTIDLDDETAQRLANVAAQAHMGAGDWVASLVRARVCGEWPSDVRQLAGAWPDFPEASELRQTGGADLPRENW
jgi:hypothetical protein